MLGNIASRGLVLETAISAGPCLTSKLLGLLEQPRKFCILDNTERGAILRMQVHMSELFSPPTSSVSSVFSEFSIDLLFEPR